MSERRKKSHQKMENAGKAKILLKHGKSYKDRNVATKRKILERRKSY